MKLRLETIDYEAADVIRLTLRDTDGKALPAWEPGAHLDFRLPSGLVRHYSLCGDPSDSLSYQVAVQLARQGRGGSAEIHHKVRVGQLLDVSEPRNNFPLHTSTGRTLLIAGGIGITPILPMAEQLESSAAEWSLLYGCRSQEYVPFRKRLDQLPKKRLELILQDTDGLPDIAGAVNALEEGALVYCCGPAPMLAAVREACAARPDVELHIEKFAAEPNRTPLENASDGATFEVELARTGTVLSVPADRTLLEVVRDVLPDVPYSCESGFCGTCETKMLAGEADHRDELLTEEERAANRTMMICVSRAKPGQKLVLDL